MWMGNKFDIPMLWKHSYKPYTEALFCGMTKNFLTSEMTSATVLLREDEIDQRNATITGMDINTGNMSNGEICQIPRGNNDQHPVIMINIKTDKTNVPGSVDAEGPDCAVGELNRNLCVEEDC